MLAKLAVFVAKHSGQLHTTLALCAGRRGAGRISSGLTLLLALQIGGQRLGGQRAQRLF
jgi:hypothetical protein